MKHGRFLKGLAALAVVLIWAALPVLAADAPEKEAKSCCMMKSLGLSAEQVTKIQELCKAHREAVRALLNDEQKKKFDAMAGCMHGAMMKEHACKMAAEGCQKMGHACMKDGKCLCQKDGKCACVVKDGKCACPDTCACKKDGKCACPCCAAKCQVKPAEAKSAGAPPCAKTCATPCTKKKD